MRPPVDWGEPAPNHVTPRWLACLVVVLVLAVALVVLSLAVA